MSYEFTNKIQELTNKLDFLKHNHPKNSKFQQIKQQLKTLEYTLNKELNIAEKRIRKVEQKIDRKIQENKKQKRPSQNLLNIQQEKVSQLIGEWVDQYQLKAQQALEDLNKEEQILKSKNEEEQHFYQKQSELLKNKINTLTRVLQKQITKLGTINAQNQSFALKQLADVKISLIKRLNQLSEAKDKQNKVLRKQSAELRQRVKDKVAVFKNKIEQRVSKTRQILILLLQI